MPPRPESPGVGGSTQQDWRLNPGPASGGEPRRVLPDWEDQTQWTIDEAAGEPGAESPLEGEQTNLTNDDAPNADVLPAPNPEVLPALDPEATAINLAAMSPTAAHSTQYVEDPEATAIKVPMAGADSAPSNLIEDPDATAIRLPVGDQTNINNDPASAQISYAELEPVEIDPVHLSIDPDTTQLNIAGDDDATDGYIFQARPLPQPSGTWDPLALPEVKADAATWTPAPTQERYQAPPEAPPPRQRASRRRVITLVLVIVMLAVGTGIGISAYRQRVVNDDATKLPVGSGAPSSAAGKTGGEVVTNYLEALSEGDITSALSLGPIGPGSRALIGPDAYPSVWRTGKITDIKVTKTDPSATEIPVTYTLNGEQVSTVMKVERHQDGTFTLVKSTVTVMISGNGDGVVQVPLLIDTRPVGWNRPFELVPGVYTASTGLPFLAITTDATLVVKDLEKVNPWTLAPQVSEQGQEAFLAAAKESLANCYKTNQLSPPNCPFVESSKQQVRTVSRFPKGDPLGSEKVTLLAEDLRMGQVQIVVSYTLALTFTTGGTSGDQAASQTATLTMDLAVANADLLKPQWKTI